MDWVPARPCQSGAHTAWPHPAAANAFNLPSLEFGEVCEPT